MTESAVDRSPDRRRFAGLLLGGAATGCAAVALGQAPAEPAGEVRPPTGSVEDLRLELVRRTDPEFLKPNRLAAVREEIRAHLVRSQVLRAFPLENGDAPAVVFRPLPPAEAS